MTVTIQEILVGLFLKEASKYGDFEADKRFITCAKCRIDIARASADDVVSISLDRNLHGDVVDEINGSYSISSPECVGTIVRAMALIAKKHVEVCEWRE